MAILAWDISDGYHVDRSLWAHCVPLSAPLAEQEVDTCLRPWGSQQYAVNWPQILAGCLLKTGDREKETGAWLICALELGMCSCI